MSFTAGATINRAYNILAEYGADKAVTTNDSNFALSMLNALTTMMENYGGFLWKKSIAYTFIELGTLEYELDGTTNTYAAYSYSATNTTADVSSTSTSLSVTSSANMLANDYLLIDVGDGTYFKTTIVSITNSTTVVLNSYPTTTIASGASVFNFPTIISTPVRIYSSGKRRYNGNATNFIDSAHDRIASLDDFYFRFGNKTQMFTTNGLAYINTLSRGELKVWGTRPASPVEILTFTHQKPIITAATTASNMDFPDRLELFLSNLLACFLAPSMEITEAKFNQMLALTDKLEKLFLRGDSETASFIPLVNNFRGQ